MEVRPGYKQTSVGLIPEDWYVKTLGQILRLRYGKSQRGIAKEGGTYPIIATGGEVGRSNQFLYDKPSVILGRKGTIDTPQYVEMPFWPIDTTYYSEISEAAVAKYLYYRLSTLDWYSFNEASGVPSLSATTVENIDIALPSILEQTAIAEALSDADAYIEALEQLIAKKRLIKHGAMQELLTGKRRLPGFDGEWELKKVSEFGEVVTGGTPSTIVSDGFGA